MSFDASTVYFKSLTDVFVSSAFGFINPNRQIDLNTTTGALCSNTIEYNSFTDTIIDKVSHNDFRLFLTSKNNLSSYINSLSSNSNYGYDMSEYVGTYNTDFNDFSIEELTKNDSQFLLIEQNNKINIVPLDIHKNLNDSDLYTDVRNYQKIYNFNKDIYIQYKTNFIDYTILSDKYNLIFNAYGTLSSHVNDFGFIENGALAGDCPLNSDIILFDTNNYDFYTNNGINNQLPFSNGTLLCLWLSSNSISGNSIWAERWYDNGQSNNSVLAPFNTLSSFSPVIDIPSNKIIKEKEKIIYLKHGKNKNDTFINSLSSNLLLDITSWKSNLVSNTNNVSGFINNYNKESFTYELDGTTYAQIPPSDSLLINGDITVSLNVSSFNWYQNFDNQLFGNLSNDSGYALIYNNGTNSNLISFPTSSNNIFSLNNKGIKVFEKDIKSDLELTNISIDYIKTDLFGNRWISDALNKKIYKLENNDIITSTIDLLSSSNITKMECDSQNHLWVFDDYNKEITEYDITGNTISSTSVPTYIDNFDIKSDDTIITKSSDLLTIDNEDRVIQLIGSTLYIDSQRVLHFTEQPRTLRIDLQNFIWVLVGNNITKISPQGKIVFSKPLNVSFVDSKIEMCFVKNNLNNKEVVDLWILYNDNRTILILDENAEIRKRISLNDIFIGSNCSDMKINLKGDFSGFDNKRKFDKVNGSTISLTNPAISLKVVLECNGINSIHQLHCPVRFLGFQNHIAFTIKHNFNQTILSLYINGIRRDIKILNGNFKIKTNSYTPFIIGGYSGRLGSRNREKAIINSGYFIGNIDNIKLYDTALNDYSIAALSKFNFSNLNIPLPCPDITVIEQIDGFNLNRYKGFKSNTFNIKIKNFTNDENLQNVVRQYILENISSMIPANTILNSIIFE